MPIRVRIFKRAGRDCFEAQWTDPVTRRKKTRSTGKNRERDAERFAARLEESLNNGTFQDDRPTTWDQFRKRFEADVLPAKAEKTQAKARSTLNAVEKFLGKPKFLVSLDAATIGRFQRLLRQADREEFTIKGHLAELRKMLRWAHRMQMIPVVPAIDVPKRLRGMKGRPITEEEFERMLRATPKVVGEKPCKSFRFLLRGLWLSGLRLGEALKLHWTDDRNIRVDLDSRRPMFQIRAHAEKGRRDRVLPMTPDFAKFLQTVPSRSRRGLVFRVVPPWQPAAGPIRQDSLSKLLSKIGEKAGIKVWTGNKGKVKFASAHDLRRSFGFRWSQRVPAATLMLLMRHASITTTMEFYVGRDAEAAADTIWGTVANYSANTDSGHQNQGSELST